MSHTTSHRRARHLLLLGCALAAAASGDAPANAAPGTDPDTAPASSGAPGAGAAGQGASPLDIEVPAGWELLPDQSARISIELNTELVAEPPVPDLPFTAHARTWRGPDAGLVVTSMHASAPAASATSAARALLDRVRATPVDAALEPGDTRLVSWNEAMTRGVAEAELTWQHLANQTTTLSRALVYATADGRPGMIRADCVIPAIDEAALAAPRAACERALDSLALTVPAERLASLDGLPPASAEAPAAGGVPGPSGAGGKPPGSLRPTPSLRAPGPGSDTVMVIPPRDSEKRSPPWLYLLGGVVLAAGLYLTLRSRREAGRMDGESPEHDQHGERDRQDRQAGTGSAPGSEPDEASSDEPGDEPDEASSGEPGDEPDEASSDEPGDEPDGEAGRSNGEERT